MANVSHLNLPLLFLALFCAAVLVQGRNATGSRVQISSIHRHQTAYHISSSEKELKLKGDSRRLMIGSVAPTCTYNECRGCRYKCRAEQVPVEGNDPMNSAYHYKCVCHR